MTTIHWINGQAGGTPLSAENLNLMQQYINNYIDDQILNVNNKINNMQAVTLYDSVSGTTSDITLSDSTENYDYLEIFYRSGYRNSVKIPNPNGKGACLISANIEDNSVNTYLSTTLVSISGNKIEVDKHTRAIFYENSNYTQNFNGISIYKVIGYKEVTE